MIGGGISGLSVAHRLAELIRSVEAPYQVVLLEACGRLGGVIETRRQNGFLLESGPDAFIVEKPWAVNLCRRLGLSKEIIETTPEHRRSFIVHKKKLSPVPEGFYLVAPTSLGALFRARTLSFAGKLRFLADLAIPPRRDSSDESVGSFVRRRFGGEALERFGQPMIGGIYTAEPDRLSLQATFPKFGEMERRHGSVLRGLAKEGAASRAASGPRYSLFVSLRGGLSTLVEALAADMPEVSIRLSARAARLESGRGWSVVLENGERLEADAVCIALPAPQAAALIESVDPEIARDLRSIPYESAVTINAAFRKTDVPHPLDGFGFVAPAVEGIGMVGCTFSSVKFLERAPDGAVLLRAFIGGAAQRRLIGLQDAELKKIVREEFRRLLGIEAEPLFLSVQRFEQAMPTYPVGHLERLESLEQKTARHRGLYLTGNGYRGTGIPDCVKQAEKAAERMFRGV